MTSATVNTAGGTGGGGTTGGAATGSGLHSSASISRNAETQAPIASANAPAPHRLNIDMPTP